MRETKKMRETRESHAACAHASHQRLLQDHQRVLQDHQSLQESRRKRLANLLPSERIKAQQTHYASTGTCSSWTHVPPPIRTTDDTTDEL